MDGHEGLGAAACAAALAEVLLLCGGDRVEKLPLEALVAFADSLEVEDVAAGSNVHSDGATQL